MCLKDYIEEHFDVPSTELISESEFQGKEVTLNKPFRTPGKKKKFGVYVKNSSGNVVVVRFGDPNMEIKRDDPDRRASFRARHNCADANDKTTPRYWSCYQWRAGANVEEGYMQEAKDEGEYGYEGDMAISQLKTVVRHAEHLIGMLKPDTDLPEWVQSKITLAEDYITTAHNYMMSEMTEEKEMKGDDPCWKDYEMVGHKMKNGKKVPNCVPKEGVNSDRAALAISKELESDKKRHDRMRAGADMADKAVKESVYIPMYVQEAAYDGNIGMMELAKFYMNATPAEKTALQTAIQKKDFKNAWKMVQAKTGVKLKGREFATESGVMKNLKRYIAGKSASQRANQEHDKAADAYDANDSATTKKNLKRSIKFDKLTQKEELELGEGLFGISSKDKGRIMNIASDVSDTPGNWDHKKQTFTNKGEVELSKQLKGNPSHIKYAKSLRSKDYEAFESVIEDNFGEMLGEETTVYVPLRFKRKEDSIYAAIHKAHGSPAKHNIGVEFNNTGKREVHVDGKKNSKLTIALNKHLDNLKEDTSVEEEAPANSVSGGGVDMNPTGKPKWDKRSKFHIDHIFKRAHGGTKYTKKPKE